MSLSAIWKHIQESTLKALLPIMAVAGITCLLLALFLIENRTAKTAINELGTILLTGAAFAAILKSFQFGGLYKQELLKVFQDESFINTIVDAVHFRGIETGKYPSILKKALGQFLAERFPQLSEDISDGLLHYSDATNDYFFESYLRHITIKSYNKVTKEIIISDSMTLKIIAPSAHKKIAYEADSSQFTGQFTIQSLSIDNQERKDEINYTNSHWKYSIKLSGRIDYLVKRTSLRTFKLNDDPYLFARFSRFAKMFSIDVVNNSPDIEFFLEHIGAREDQKTKSIKEGNSTSLSVNKLAFPGQGYAIVITEK